ncbi:MAG TPA: FtsH protease activity modulator HflK [Steroidobacteraceae bacterium]|nr:FtsH protease activity modulator HflK [Steroidobacteraceae bacterium]
MAWNDPGEKRNPWNRQRPQNDLDEILRNLRRRIAGLFGRKPPAGGAKPPVNFGRGVVLILVVIGALWIGSGLYRVDAQERAVILRFGKYVATTGPGYNWHLPWPIERKLIVNVSHLYSVTDEESVLTSDTNLVEVKSAVQYTQPDPLRLLFQVRDVDETLTQVCESAMREAIGQTTLDQALAMDPSIAIRARALIQNALDAYDTGIHVVSVNLTDVNVPEPVQEAQRDAIKADKDRQRYEQEAQAYRNDLLPRAHGDAAKAIQDAKAYKAKVIALAQGDTARFDDVLAQYQRAPAVTRERMYLGTVEDVYKHARKIIVETKGGNNVIYLPLDKLIAPLPPAAAPDLPADAGSSPPAHAADGQGAAPAAGDGAPANGGR